MTAIRYSIRIGKETAYGSGKPKDGWYDLPPGTKMSATHNVSTETVYTAGSKFFDTAVYGATSDSWELSFDMDYDHIWPFEMIFENHTVKKADREGFYEHTFTKTNNTWIQPFVIERTTLNGMTGGSHGSDERTTFSGCIAKSIRISRSSGSSSKATVTISGAAKKPKTELGDFKSNYKDYEGQLVEFACMFYGDEYVANVESMTIGIDTGANVRRSTCTPFPVGYYEDKTSFQFGMTTYANDPKRYMLRVYTGGQDGEKSSLGTNVYGPMCKNKVPCPEISMKSFDTCCTKEGTTQESIEDALARAGYSASFDIEDCVLKSTTWQKGDGRLLDQMSSAECKRITLTIVNKSKTYPGQTVSSTASTE